MNEKVTPAFLRKIEERLGNKVRREYDMGFNHVRDERTRKREIVDKVLDTNVPEGQVRVNLLWRNIQLEKALFLTDEISVKMLASEGITGQEIMDKANVVMKYDDVDMNLREQREAIVDYNALYGLAATVVDNWDEDEVQPMSDCIDPLSLIIDPNCYSGSKARFIGYERRLSEENLENSP